MQTLCINQDLLGEARQLTCSPHPRVVSIVRRNKLLILHEYLIFNACKPEAIYVARLSHKTLRIWKVLSAEA